MKKYFNIVLILSLCCVLSTTIYSEDLFLEEVPKKNKSVSLIQNEKVSDQKNESKSISKKQTQDAQKKESPKSKPKLEAVSVDSNSKDQYRTQIGLNLESVLIRGDVSVFQERQKGSNWSTILQAHFNPHNTYNDETGKLGVSAGGRLYLPFSQFKKNAVFFQLMGGFNYFSGGDILMGVDLGLGYHLDWDSNINWEFLLMAHRGYADRQDDLELFLGVNLGVDLEKPLLNLL